MAVDLVRERYSAAGGPTAKSAVLSGSVRPFVEEFTAERQGARADPANTNLLTALAISQTTNGTLTAVASDIAGGKRIDLSGTSAGAGVWAIYLNASAALPLAGSTTYTLSYKLKGALNGSGREVQIGLREVNSAQAQTANTSISGNKHFLQADKAFPIAITRTTQAATASGQVKLEIVVGASDALTGYVEVTEAQATAGDNRLPYAAPGSPVANDSLALASSADAILAGDFALSCIGRPPTAGGNGTLLQIGDTTNGILAFLDGYVAKVRCYVSGAATDTTIGRTLFWGRTNLMLSLSGTTLKASMNGAPPKACSTPPTARAGCTLGRGTAGAFGGALEAVALWPAGMSDAALQAASKVTGQYDDFERPDGALGSPWSGSPYTVTGTGEASIVSGKVITTASQALNATSTSRYFGSEQPAKVRRIMAAVTWSAGANSAQAGLITCQVPPTAFTPTVPGGAPASGGWVDAIAGPGAKALHILVNWAGATFGVENGSGSDQIVEQMSFRLQMARDSATIYSFGWLLPGDGSFVFRMPDGNLVRMSKILTQGVEQRNAANQVTGTSYSYDDFNGPFAVPESFWNVSNPARPDWDAWQIEAVA